MAKGKAQAEYLGREGLIQSVDAPDFDFLYETSTVQSPKYNLGDRVVLPDGRVFRYGKSGAAITAGLGVAFYQADAAASGNPAAAQAVGDKSFTMASQTFTADQLRGGYVIFGMGSTTQIRGIIGNTVGAASTITVYLDAALDQAITTSTYLEICYNPYVDLRTGNFAGTVSYAGVSARNVSAASMYFWVQTWGPAWASPQSGIQASDYAREAYFRHDGSLDVRGNIGTFVSDQRAGFVIARGSTQSAPLVMLQVAP